MGKKRSYQGKSFGATRAGAFIELTATQNDSFSCYNWETFLSMEFSTFNKLVEGKAGKRQLLCLPWRAIISLYYYSYCQNNADFNWPEKKMKRKQTDLLKTICIFTWNKLSKSRVLHAC